MDAMQYNRHSLSSAVRPVLERPTSGGKRRLNFSTFMIEREFKFSNVQPLPCQYYYAYQIFNWKIQRWLVANVESRFPTILTNRQLIIGARTHTDALNFLVEQPKRQVSVIPRSLTCNAIPLSWNKLTYQFKVGESGQPMSK